MSVTTANIITKIRGKIKDLLKSNGRDYFQYQGDNTFHLSANYVSETGMKVFQNGTEISTDDWSYDSDTNQVTIVFTQSGDELIDADDIIIKFNYYEKYSDTEITSYIESSLLMLSNRRYCKTFYMNDADEVVTDNGENPTEEEGNLIATITAIDIDPQNINVKIGNDFTINAVEKKSKTELIDDVITNFTRTFGTISFLEIEE